MAIGTYEQYKERLLKMEPSVYPNGKCMDRFNGKEGKEKDLVDWIKEGTHVMKQCYDVANNPKHEDVCVATSHINGERINRCTHIHHSMDDLLRKQLMTRLICQHVGGCMQRCIGTDAMNTLYSVTYGCDEACGTECHKRLLAYIEYCRKYDLICNCAQTDAKDSRNPKYKRAHMQPDPDSFVHVVEADVGGTGVNGKPRKGIIVWGAKICNPCASYVDEIIVNPTKFMSQDDSDYTVAFALPAGWDGVKLMALPGLHHERAHLDASYAQIGDVESLTTFDDCFVPYDRVFVCGHDHEGVARYAGYLALMFAHYHCHSYTGCKAIVSEVIASQAAFMTDVNDIVREPHVREKICDTIQTTELVLAADKVAAHHAMEFPSGQRVPDEVLINAGRRLAGYNMYHGYETLADLTGGVCASLPTEKSFFAPETAELCNKYIRRNPIHSTEDTHRVIRMMESKLCDSYEVAQAVTGVRGGGSLLMETITFMSCYDPEELRKIAKYLTGIPGYGKCLCYRHGAYTATSGAMLVKFDAISSKKEGK